MSSLEEKFKALEGATVIKDLSQLDEQQQKLIEICKTHCAYSYSPYSNFAVGASVLLDNGEIIGGSNQENASYPLCMCAEKTALGAASSFYPNVPIKALAVTAFKAGSFVDQTVSPCGSCRQVIAEYAQRYNQAIPIIMYSSSYTVVIDSIYRLLPLNFKGEDFLI